MVINPELREKRSKNMAKKKKERLKSNQKVRYLNYTEKEHREDERKNIIQNNL